MFQLWSQNLSPPPETQILSFVFSDIDILNYFVYNLDTKIKNVTASSQENKTTFTSRGLERALQ